MRRYLLPVVVMVLSTPALAAPPPPPFDALESEVFTAQGTPQQLAGKAKICLAQLVKNDVFSIGDVHTTPFGGRNQETHETLAGGSVIASYDEEAGIVVANSRKSWHKWPMDWSVQSTVTFVARDDRFKINHANIMAASRESSYFKNKGYEPVHPKSFLVKDITKQLGELNTAIAACVNAQAKDW
jgi:hypothetical protein